MLKKALCSSFLALAVSLFAVAGPSEAATRQRGLVNLNIEDVTVQIPVAVALNICDVNVAVLVGTIVDGPAQCTAEGGSIAIVEDDDDGNGNTTQDGLINVNLQDIEVQVPIAIAANVCDINVAVLVGVLAETGTTDCDAGAGSIALIG